MWWIRRKEVPNIKDVEVVNEFEDVFPDDLPGLPPDREIEFAIELAPGTAPVSKAPYRLGLRGNERISNSTTRLA